MEIISMWRQDMVTLSLYWPFMRGNRRSPVDSPQYKGQSRELWSFLWYQPKYTVEQKVELQIDLRRYDAHYDVTAVLLNDSLLCYGRTTV